MLCVLLYLGAAPSGPGGAIPGLGGAPTGPALRCVTRVPVDVFSIPDSLVGAPGAPTVRPEGLSVATGSFLQALSETARIPRARKATVRVYRVIIVVLTPDPRDTLLCCYDVWYSDHSLRPVP